MRRIFTIVLFGLLPILQAHAQGVPNLLDAHVWLRTDTDSFTPLKWSDVSPYGNHAVVVLPDESPLDKASLNFHRAILFDGINDYLKIPYSLESLSQITLIAVFHSADTVERGIWGTENGTVRNTLLTTRRAKGPEEDFDLYGNHEGFAVVNTIAQNWNKTAPPGTIATGSTTPDVAYFALGSAGKSLEYKPFKGAIAELIIFDRALNFMERAQIETYLAIKYGVPLRTSNYVSSQENLLWHTENNIVYSSRIAGVGRDDAFSLYQKQARSAYDTTLLVFTAGSMAKSNEENKSVINDQDFLIYGDNNFALTTKASEGTDSLLSFIERKWMLQASGATAHQLSSQLRINLSALQFSTMGYWVAVDRSGTGNFDRDNLEYIKASSFERTKEGNDIAIFNVKWDTDRSGKDMFGLTVAKNFYALVRTLANPLCEKRDAGKIAIEILGTDAPYRFELKNAKENYSKSWQGSNLREELANLVAGDYVLTVRNANNEKVVRNFSLKYPDALKIDLGPDQKMTDGQVVTLDASAYVSPAAGATYQWESNNGFTSSDAKVEVSKQGLYKVSVTNATGCVFIDEVALSGEENRFEVFPTIVHEGKYSIGISLQEPGEVNVKVFSGGGILREEMTGTGSSEYLFSGTAKEPGLYLIVMQSPKGIETRKVIVY